MKRLFSSNSGNEGVPFALLLPNLVTLTGMCLGLTSIRFAMDGRFKTAVVLILLAAVMDGLDGLIARRLNATSRLGAELDSLSDFLCFGVAPALLVYHMILDGTGSLGWIAVLTFAGASCLRLARFNVMRSEPDKSEDSTARARPLRMRWSSSEHQRVRRAQMGGVEVSASGHKSDCRSTAGEDQQGLRFCGLEGRRCMQ